MCVSVEVPEGVKGEEEGGGGRQNMAEFIIENRHFSQRISIVISQLYTLDPIRDFSDTSWTLVLMTVQTDKWDTPGVLTVKTLPMSQSTSPDFGA